MLPCLNPTDQPCTHLPSQYLLIPVSAMTWSGLNGVFEKGLCPWLLCLADKSIPRLVLSLNTFLTFSLGLYLLLSSLWQELPRHTLHLHLADTVAASYSESSTCHSWGSRWCASHHLHRSLGNFKNLTGLLRKWSLRNKVTLKDLWSFHSGFSGQMEQPSRFWHLSGEYEMLSQEIIRGQNYWGVLRVLHFNNAMTLASSLEKLSRLFRVKWLQCRKILKLNSWVSSGPWC
jgi:hypothetical protein